MAALQDIFIRKFFFTNICYSLGQFYKKDFLKTIKKFSHNYKKNNENKK